MKVSPIIPVAMIVVALCLSTDASAQKKHSAKKRQATWHVYYPPDSSFRIETPKRFRYGKDPEYKWLESYSSAVSEACRQVFAVLVGRFEPKERPDNPSSMFLMIGGSHTDPTSEADITVDGFKAKDYVYSRPFDTGCKYRRGRIIDAGPHIFWVIYGSDRLESLESPRTMRFLKSFHPQVNTQREKGKGQ